MSFNISSCSYINEVDIVTESECRIIVVDVIINEIEPVISSMIQEISNTSWITDMDAYDQKAYEAKAKPTVDKIVNKVLNKSEDCVDSDSGEYIISCSAQYVLEEKYDHTRIVLAELFGKRVSGNSGFDFHSESDVKLLLFGEAKFSSSGNPYTNALNQIVEFIEDKKDDQDLSDLRHFASTEAMESYMQKNKGYIAAFSLNAINSEEIYEKVVELDSFKELTRYKELYVLGIKIDA